MHQYQPVEIERVELLNPGGTVPVRQNLRIQREKTRRENR